jgi:hypothetical protein
MQCRFYNSRYRTPGRSRVVSKLAFALCAIALSVSVRADDSAELEFFEKRIRPVLAGHCYQCHSSISPEAKGKLRLDTRAGILKGGESGPAVVPGDSADSLLLSALKHESFEMPPGKRLPDSVIRDFSQWIRQGAIDPRDTPAKPAALAEEIREAEFQQRSTWWSFQPLKQSSPPTVDSTAWSKSSIDRFLFAKLASQKLEPQVRADRHTLIRRLSFALTGLPPTPGEVDSFVNDDSAVAWSTAVDRLLASPHFGERWARHWMDAVRYTDTYGYEWDVPAKGAWRYRDYLIRAFNQDVPFDQLVREQIAGDLLPEPRINSQEQINESKIGVMFYQLGEKRHGDSSEFNGIHQEMLDNKIDAFSKAFQALTISCARCHDHKLDPIAQTEYYALAGIFMSSRWLTNTVDLPERNSTTFANLRQLKSDLRQQLADRWTQDLAALQSVMLAPSPTTSTDLPPGSATPDSAAPAASKLAAAWQKLLAAKKADERTLEDPLRLWSRLKKSTSPADVSATWKTTADTWARESAKRAAENAGHFKVVADFRNGIPDGWSVDGAGLSDPVRSGDFTVALSGGSAIGNILPGGLFTNSLSPRLNGAVRTPLLDTFEHGHLSFEYAGGDFAAHRCVIDNAFITEKQKYLKHPEPTWERLSARQEMKDRRLYIEFATKTSNPNFPPRVGLGGPCSEAQAAAPESWFGITRVVNHVAPHTPLDELARFATLFERGLDTDKESPKTLDEAAGRYIHWLSTAVAAWRDDKATPEHVQLLTWLLTNKLVSNSLDALPDQTSRLVEQYRKTEQQIKLPWTVNGMLDQDNGVDYRLNIRGDYDELGDAVPRGYLKLLQSNLRAGNEGRIDDPRSGRLELARIVSGSDNPLTARVFVNRVWHWLFGTGLVATPGNFGLLGDRPSHPELLDWLTERFMAEGWSVKKLVRQIVLTEAWRQSSSSHPQAREIDPRNRLLHHYPLRRLEAEAIRDSIQLVSGRLDRTLFGPTDNPHRANEDAQKRLFSGPLDGNGRRAIYTKVTIMEPPRFLAMFNQPKPKIPTGRRDVTSTPTQALALLNDPFVLGQAEFWANRLISNSETATSPDTSSRQPEDRIAEMFQTAFARKPSPVELRRWTIAVHELTTLHNVAENAIMPSRTVWKDVAHAFFNSKEFIYVK